MPIVLLNAQIINKIAAGEVVYCPASVVKELVENSIDAGAKSINVQVDKGGRNFISVSDDGCGIPCEEMETAFICHATSKLHGCDLENVRTMGFRGEGLTSIAAVARVKMVSKHVDADKAWSITFEGGEKTKNLSPGVLSCGTHVEVRDLFFATPARLKFLRTEKAEIQNMVDLLNRLAIINFSIAFSLTIVDRQVFKYSSQKALVDRLCEMKAFGDGFMEQSLEVDYMLDYIKIHGYISLPTFNRSKPGMTYTFVNNRPIHSPLILGAVKAAYSGLIPKDRHPIVVLSLDVPHSSVDVNVHPSKQEVRFQDKRLVYKAVFDALSKALSKNVYSRFTQSDGPEGRDHFAVDNFEKTYGQFSGTDTADFTATSAPMELRPDILQPSVSWPGTEGGGQRVHSDFSYAGSFKPSEIFAEEPCAHHEHVTTPHLPLSGGVGSLKGASERTGEQCSMLVNDHPLGYPVCQLFERYIVSRAKDYIVIVDQHAAHERLVCEYIKKVTEQEGIKRQVLLIPEFVELANEYEVELLSEYRGKLQNLGLVVEPLGDLTVIVREVPAIFGAVDVKALISKIVEGIVAEGEELFMQKRLSHICGTIACYGSIRSGRVMKLEEMESLLRNMESTPHSGQCNHGRPTYVKLSLSEIDRLFERT
ncbi:DNA mismatch repair protein MutL [Anaplasma platys]|uniref:DNA mismatch repair protein MutL n=1 Tax=Anaplasma platys TaxID=949 RepID=A0A858PYQ6_9RICK|nr:DNA mismatch repair endonuclease MutL [Anaplasma platys]QJC27743.1 DNA mismatch repair protein MutL [Anaplasma platys]